MNSFLHQIHMKNTCEIPMKIIFALLLVSCEHFLMNFTCWDFVCALVQPDCRTMIYFSGDARFVSVTYRLLKPPPGTKGEPTQVIYNGQISGYEKEFRFDHQHVFKVCILGL